MPVEVMAQYVRTGALGGAIPQTKIFDSIEAFGAWWNPVRRNHSVDLVEIRTRGVGVWMTYSSVDEFLARADEP